jgi:hypothetical protein
MRSRLTVMRRVLIAGIHEGQADPVSTPSELCGGPDSAMIVHVSAMDHLGERSRKMRTLVHYSAHAPDLSRRRPAFARSIHSHPRALVARPGGESLHCTAAVRSNARYFIADAEGGPAQRKARGRHPRISSADHGPFGLTKSMGDPSAGSLRRPTWISVLRESTTQFPWERVRIWIV